MVKRYLIAGILALSIPVLGAAEPRVVVQENERDFGRVTAGEALTHSFVLKNAGTSDLLIRRVLTS